MVLTYLALDEVGGDDLAAVSIEECQSGAEGRRGDTPEDRLSDHAPPARLSLVDG